MRARLLGSVGIGIALLFAASGLLVNSLLRASLEDELDDALRSQADALSVLVEQDGASIETDLEQQLMPEFRPGPDARYFQVWRADGTALARSASLGDRDLDADETPIGTSRIRAVRLPDGRIGRQVTSAFYPRVEDARVEDGDGAARGSAVLVVARSTAELERTMARLRTILFAAGSAVLILTLLLLVWIVRFGLRPLGDVAARISAVGHADLSTRLDIAGAPAELASVVGRINDLLSRLEEAFARERALTADVAHELRTPLSGLVATLELALTREREPARYREVIGDCLEICRSTSRMLESLLALARADAGRAEVGTDSISIAAMLEAALEPVAPRISSRALTVHTTLEPDLIATTDADKLVMILGNLIDNAVTYADEGGRIEIDGARGAGQLILTLTNSGCDLDAADAARVFDRFWRGDSARAVGVHAGIGLALCRRLAHLLGGELEVSVGGGDFTVSLSLPEQRPP